MSEAPAGLPIGEVARRSGLRVSAIRYYEALGLLPPARRVGGKRRFGPDALDRLAIVRFARAAGFRLDEIRRLLQGPELRPPPERWRVMAAAKLQELDRTLARVRASRQLLATSLEHRCPGLVERGEALRAHGRSAPAPDRPLRAPRPRRHRAGGASPAATYTPPP